MVKGKKKFDKRYFGSFEAISDISPRAAKAAFKGVGYVEKQLFLKWVDIVGKDISSYTTPYSLKFRSTDKGGEMVFDGAVLSLFVHSCYSLKVQHLEPVIKEKIATYFGYNVINKIKIIQKLSDKQEKKPLDNKTLYYAKKNVENCELDAILSSEYMSAISDPALKGALLGLSKAIAKD